MTHDFKIGDKVYLNSPLKEGRGTVINILLADVEYTLDTVWDSYRFKTDERIGLALKCRKLKFDRLIIQRDNETVHRVVIPMTDKRALRIVTKLT